MKKQQNMLIASFRKKSSNQESAVKEKIAPRNSTPTIIASDMLIEGQVISQGLVEIEGKIKGSVRSHSVVLLEKGIIEGDVIAESFCVRGKFLGNIIAQNVNIASKANVVGTIEYGLLSVEDGAAIDAQFKKLHKK
ncbi:MAG: polymer-forming cytoskeletal protein [Pelagibacterales bacterium]|nr:polymer-forming cytoskeletal protein [Pelagibacterales bacterium]